MSSISLLKKVVLLWLLAVMPGFASDNDSIVEIDFLLDTVAHSDCLFIRNGKTHSPADAVDHLQMKRRRGARYFTTTEEFIDRLASKSSWSGKPYLIQCQDQAAEPAGDWFTRHLLEYRSARTGTE